MSNILAALGRGQLQALDDRVCARRRNFDHYRERLAALPGISFMPEPNYGRANRWLTCITIDSDSSGTNPDRVRNVLESHDIEARPIWKPMHLQPLFSECPVTGGGVSKELFRTGLCLPSGSSLNSSDLDRICDLISDEFTGSAAP
jgi:pyridoxal phosphate-dependent aminotransferase EpsN